MRVLTVGGAMIDTIAVIANERIERMTMRNADASFLLLEQGRKNEADEISTHCGGGAVNAAVAMARLGHDVAALIKLGPDARAETILRRLEDEGVSTRYAIRDPRAPTGASVLISAHDRNAAIFTFRGANTLLEPHDLKKEAFAARLVYVSSLSNESAECFPSIVAHAKSEGALVAVNPGIRQLSLRQNPFRDSIGKIDILAINRDEADALVPLLVSVGGEGGPQTDNSNGTTLPYLARRGFVMGGFELSMLGFFGRVLNLGPKWVVVTDGSRGAYIGSHSGCLFCPPVHVDVTGSAGAGDAFNATFACCIAASVPVEDAALCAATNAASVVTHLDTQTGLLRQPELQARVAKVRQSADLIHWSL